MHYTPIFRTIIAFSLSNVNLNLLPEVVFMPRMKGILSFFTTGTQTGCHIDSALGTEELGHLEMIGAIVHQLTRNLKDSQIQDSAFAPYFVDHTTGVYPTAASGAPWNAFSMQVKGDPLADLVEDMGAEAAPHHTAIGFCHFLASRKVVAAQGFFGLLKGEPFC